jgi:DNA-directed RNA polymerase subunit H (RpoH/RPB5)
LKQIKNIIGIINMASSGTGSGNTSVVHKSREIMLKYLDNQGYNVSDYNDTSVNEVHSMIQNKQLDMLMDNNDNRKVYVKYHLGKSLRPQYIHDIIDDLYILEQILTIEDMLIVIIKDEPNDTMVNLLKHLYADKQIYISVFNINRLQFNILEHIMVPEHKKLTNEEAIKFKKDENINNDSQIPEISRFDPVALAIGLKPGDICKIIRPSRISITSDYYRFCINN